MGVWTPCSLPPLDPCIVSDVACIGVIRICAFEELLFVHSWAISAVPFVLLQSNTSFGEAMPVGPQCFLVSCALTSLFEILGPILMAERGEDCNSMLKFTCMNCQKLLKT